MEFQKGGRISSTNFKELDLHFLFYPFDIILSGFVNYECIMKAIEVSIESKIENAGFVCTDCLT